nr:hypothetical protein [Jiangella gansuensis]
MKPTRNNGTVAACDAVRFTAKKNSFHEKITQIYEGTNQIQRMVMARQLLKGVVSF